MLRCEKEKFQSLSSHSQTSLLAKPRGFHSRTAARVLQPGQHPPPHMALFRTSSTFLFYFSRITTFSGTATFSASSSPEPVHPGDHVTKREFHHCVIILRHFCRRRHEFSLQRNIMTSSFCERQYSLCIFVCAVGKIYRQGFFFFLWSISGTCLAEKLATFFFFFFF